MAAPVTEEYDQMVLEMSTDDGTTWTRICGMDGVQVTRAANSETNEVPADCDDETKPHEVRKNVRSVEVSASGTGVWAQQSHESMMDWFYGESGSKRMVRLGHLNAAPGDTEYEQGNAILTQLDNARTKGQVVTAEIQIEFDRTPTRVAKA